MNTTPIRVLALGAGLAVALGACSSVSSYAAKVDGDRISTSTLEDELRDISRNARYVESIEMRSPLRVKGAGQGTFAAAFTARVLTLQIYARLVDDELERRRITLTRADLDTGRRSQLESLQLQMEVDEVAAEGVLRGFPQDYQDTLVRRAAATERLVLALRGAAEPEAAVRKYYEDNRSRFVRACVSHILVDTKEKGDEVLARVTGGEDFAAVAQAESRDAGSAARGGELRCYTAGDAVEPAFRDVIFSQPVGQPTPPVQTREGFHVLRVNSREPAPFEEVADAVRNAIRTDDFAQSTTWLRDAAKKAKVEVNPRYGTFNKNPPGDALPEVVPPEAPASSVPSSADVDTVPRP